MPVKTLSGAPPPFRYDFGPSDEVHGIEAIGKDEIGILIHDGGYPSETCFAMSMTRNQAGQLADLLIALVVQ